MKAGEFPDGARHFAREDRHERAECLAARSGALSHPARRHIITPATNGAFIRCTTGRTRFSDYIEGITHSLCTLEFEVHRPLYDWILDIARSARARARTRYEFARLNLTYTVMSKRKLIQLVNEKLVNGWDDPRMPTISGFRRRGVTASALRAFAYNIGITKYPSMTDMARARTRRAREFNRNAAAPACRAASRSKLC